MQDCKPCDTPMAKAIHLPKLDAPTINRTRYQCIVGSLMHAMISTHPDIAFTTGLLAQHATSPGDDHWNAAKCVLRYLQGTRERGIVYAHSKNPKLISYVNADYAGDKNSSRSTTGWVFLMSRGSVAWSACKQPTVSLSSTEAEYVTTASAAHKIIWARQFLSKLGFLSDGPTVLLTDNQSSMVLARNPANHQSTKHIHVKYHFIREVIELQEVELWYTPTEEQVADTLTKLLGHVKFLGFVSGMGMD
jgi:hypothetical protein